MSINAYHSDNGYLEILSDDLEFVCESGANGIWFRDEELAFDRAMEQVICTFPSYDIPDVYTSDEWQERFPHVPIEDSPWITKCWLIGKAADGNWMAEWNADAVDEIPADWNTQIGPTQHGWNDEPKKNEEEINGESGIG
ncbi:MAG: hypothetical protein IJ662_10735 [Clostridia bacterium]|nr:hypothetical protein [Clostridia bacterium]